ncbi:MAG TPA: DUF6351 family protein [Thermoleophilaceae bacterium]|nr:DUF6351 family protein [Thermoleophilaceae bacterium]
MRRRLIAPLALAAAALGATPVEAGAVKIEVLSSRADLVSGGDAVVAISAKRASKLRRLEVRLNRRKVTRRFRMRDDGRRAARIKGLRNGRNVIVARRPNGLGKRLVIRNHPNGGPVFSGPQVKPWTCQEAAVDDQCNQPAEYTFLYKPEESEELAPYDPENPPDDVAMTTTDEGVEVPFIVRQELGYQDRDQYRIITLFKPGSKWSRWDPQKQWNQKLLITHGGGCGGDYDTSSARLDDYSGTIPPTPGYVQSYVTALGRGFAVGSTALNNNGHNCNIVVQAESMLMMKERLVERYGDLRHTIGTGCSGGSITQQQVANAYPGGVYDGLVVTCAYPDSLSTGSQFADYHLLRIYFEDTSRWGPGVVWTPSQWAAVEGRPDPVNAIAADELFFKDATNPAGDCVSAEVVYNRQTNPGGVRCSVLDYMINVLGPRPESVWSEVEKEAGRGFAGAPFANEGVQFGLGALRQGLITPAQFLDLNAKIGGFGIDAEQVPERLAGDDASIANAYRSGAINEGNNLDQVAIIDHAGPDPGLAHDYVHTWWMRDRLEREQGHLGNYVLWFGPTPLIGDVDWATEAMIAMDRWLTAVEADTSNKPLARKIVDEKPEDLLDRCTATVCEQYLATRYETPRSVADGPKTGDVNKCQLRPPVREDYPLTITNADFERLAEIFPTGVCDWAKPGVGQQGAIPWMTYQRRSGKVIYGGSPLGPEPRSKRLRRR